MPSPRRVKKSARKSARKARKSARKSARKTKRSYRMDPPQKFAIPLEMPELLGGRSQPRESSVRLLQAAAAAFPRREIDPEEVRKERVKKLIEDATLGWGISGNDLQILTPDEKIMINNIYKMFTRP